MKKRIFSILILLMCIVPVYSVFADDTYVGGDMTVGQSYGATEEDTQYIYCEYNLNSVIPSNNSNSFSGKPISFNKLYYRINPIAWNQQDKVGNQLILDDEYDVILDGDSLEEVMLANIKEIYSDGDYAYKKYSSGLNLSDKNKGDYFDWTRFYCPKYAIVNVSEGNNVYLFYDKKDYSKVKNKLDSQTRYAYAENYAMSRKVVDRNKLGCKAAEKFEAGVDSKWHDSNVGDDITEEEYMLRYCSIGTDSEYSYKDEEGEAASGYENVEPDQNPKISKIGSASNVQPGVQKACSSLSVSTCSSDPRCTVDGGSCVADEEFIGDGFCYNGNVLRSIRIIGYLLALVKLFVPLIIVGFSIMEFYKSVINVDKDTATKQARKVLIRVLIGMSIFFIPGLVHGFLQAFYNHDFKSHSILQCESCLLKPFECDVNKFSTSNSGKTTDNDSSSSSETEVNCSSLALDSCSSTSTCTWNGSSCVKK